MKQLGCGVSMMIKAITAMASSLKHLDSKHATRAWAMVTPKSGYITRSLFGDPSVFLRVISSPQRPPMATSEEEIPEVFSQRISFPYTVTRGPNETGPEGMTVGDLVLKEVRGMYMKKGNSWYLIDRTYYSENPTADDLKLGEFMAKVMSDATNGGVENSPDHYPDEETIKSSTPPTIYDAARHYVSVVTSMDKAHSESDEEKKRTCRYSYPG